MMDALHTRIRLRPMAPGRERPEPLRRGDPLSSALGDGGPMPITPALNRLPARPDPPRGCTRSDLAWANPSAYDAPVSLRRRVRALCVEGLRTSSGPEGSSDKVFFSSAAVIAGALHRRLTPSLPQ